MESGDLPPQVFEDLVTHVVGRRQLERLDVRLARDDECVVLRAESDGDHLGNANAGLCRHQRCERFVLDLLESTDGCAARRITVGEEPPAARQPLRVLSVSTEHADLDRAPIRRVSEVLGRAHPLPLGDSQTVHRDAERGQRGANSFRRWHSRRRAERESHERARGQAECNRSQHLRREAGAEHHGAESRHSDEPERQHSRRPNELRACDREDRHRAGKAELGKAPIGEHVRFGLKPVHVDDATED